MSRLELSFNTLFDLIDCVEEGKIKKVLSDYNKISKKDKAHEINKIKKIINHYFLVYIIEQGVKKGLLSEEVINLTKRGMDEFKRISEEKVLRAKLDNGTLTLEEAETYKKIIAEDIKRAEEKGDKERKFEAGLLLSYLERKFKK